MSETCTPTGSFFVASHCLRTKSRVPHFWPVLPEVGFSKLGKAALDEPESQTNNLRDFILAACLGA
jgi:hypothetical protein